MLGWGWLAACVVGVLTVWGLAMEMACKDFMWGKAHVEQVGRDLRRPEAGPIRFAPIGVPPARPHARPAVCWADVPSSEITSRPAVVTEFVGGPPPSVNEWERRITAVDLELMEIKARLAQLELYQREHGR